MGYLKFPLIQLPRKSEVEQVRIAEGNLAQEFPLIQLPRKSEETALLRLRRLSKGFPLIQLPRKSEAETEKIRGEISVASFH